MSTGRQAYRTVTLSIRELIASSAALNTLAQAKPSNQRLKMALANVNKQVLAAIGEHSTYAELVKTLTEECARRNAAGEFVMTADGRDIEIQPAKRQRWIEQIKDLQAVEVELRIPSLQVDDMDKLGVELTVGDAAGLIWLFEEQPYEIPSEASPPQPGP